MLLCGLLTSCCWRGAGECGRRGGYLEVVNVAEDVAAELYKLASINLCSNVNGQICTAMVMNPPKVQPSHSLSTMPGSIVLQCWTIPVLCKSGMPSDFVSLLTTQVLLTLRWYSLQALVMLIVRKLCCSIGLVLLLLLTLPRCYYSAMAHITTGCQHVATVLSCLCMAVYRKAKSRILCTRRRGKGCWRP